MTMMERFGTRLSSIEQRSAKETPVEGPPQTAPTALSSTSRTMTMVKLITLIEKFSGGTSKRSTFALQMRTYYGRHLDGKVGELMAFVSANRDVDAKVTAMGPEARETAEILYDGLVQLTVHPALTYVRNAGVGEGLEAWRRLHDGYDPHTRQSRVTQLMELLGTDSDMKHAMTSKDKFELDWPRWENRLQKKDFSALMNDLKIGTLPKGMNATNMKHQRLMESEAAAVQSAVWKHRTC